jgi:RES domain-containing protein
MHNRRYPAEDPDGARLVSGRYNRGLDRFPEGETFPALYLATAPEICLGEVYRRVTPELLPSLNDFRLSELSVSLHEIADYRDPSALGLTPEDLAHDTGYRAAQSLGAAADAHGVEGLLVPSATGLGQPHPLPTEPPGSLVRTRSL